jgi:hypothetical protein
MADPQIKQLLCGSVLHGKVYRVFLEVLVLITAAYHRH